MNKVPNLDINSRRFRRSLSNENVSQSGMISIERAADRYKVISKSIDDIKSQLHPDSLTEIRDLLDEIKSCVLFDNLNIGSEIKSMRHNIYNLVMGIESSPRILSRVDAIVGNGQVILTKLGATKREIVEDLESHDEALHRKLDRIIKTQEELLETQSELEQRIKSIESIILKINDSPENDDV